MTRKPGRKVEPADASAPPTAPRRGTEAPQGDPGDLGGVIAQLREELAAQREENARLRESLAALTSALARLAGDAGVIPDKIESKD